MPLSKLNIKWGYLVAFLLLILSYFFIFYIISELGRQTEKVKHSYAVINNLESIKTELIDAETGVRGYLLTSEVRFLKPYNTGSKNVAPLFKELTTLTADNTNYKQRLTLLNQLLNQRLVSLEESITNFQRNGFKVSDKMKANRDENWHIMGTIRSTISNLQDEERALMRQRDSRLSGFFSTTRSITIVSLFVALITIVYSVFVYIRENKAKEQAVKNATIYSMQLEQRVNELDRLNIQLGELKSMEKFAATGRIARTIAHEVRNPLTNITLAAEQLKDITGKNEDGEILFEMIGRNAVRINQLVSDLLNSTRFAQLEYTKVNINQLIDEALQMAADRLELNRIKVEKYYGTDICEILVDKEKLKIAFLNIIVNSIEAMQKDTGILKIRSRKQGDKCIIDIEDNGVGMDEETIQKLYEPYFTNKLKGNGLGLTNTQNIILNHKGNINVQSKKDAGSTFTISLALS